MTPADAAKHTTEIADMLAEKGARYIVLPMDVARALVEGVTQPSTPEAGCSESASLPPQTPPT